jgi:hypothetical protein
MAGRRHRLIEDGLPLDERQDLIPPRPLHAIDVGRTAAAALREWRASRALAVAWLLPLALVARILAGRRKEALRLHEADRTEAELANPRSTARAAGGLPSRLDRRQQQPDEHRDDRDHHEEFYEREGTTANAGRHIPSPQKKDTQTTREGAANDPPVPPHGMSL